VIEVALSAPRLHWRGPGYLDSNAGCGPLEARFDRWDWSRSTGRTSTGVLYDVARRDGTTASWALRFDSRGGVEQTDPPPPVTLPRTGWAITRNTRADPGGVARVVETLEDGPFYARTRLESRLHGEAVTAIHETVSLERFRRPWVRALLPFRMPRRG
jgi:carotenoid 1,2-hydratase